MKIELDLNEEQMLKLNDNVSAMLESLDKEQINSILTEIINRSFNKLVFNQDLFGKGLTDFGNKILQSAREEVTNIMFTSVLKDSEFKKEIDDTIDRARNNLSYNIENAISQYIINNLFINKETLQNEIRNGFYNLSNDN